VWLGVSPFVVVHDLQLVKEVLHSPTSAKNYEKGMFAEIMRPLLGQGLLLSEGILIHLVQALSLHSPPLCCFVHSTLTHTHTNL
jgi:hypothetical protein